MAVPPFKVLFLPLLKALSDGETHDNKTLPDILASMLELPEIDRTATYKSGVNIFAHRIGWATLGLVKAGFAERPRPGHLRILPRGVAWLESSPDSLTEQDFQQFPEFQEWINSFGSKKTDPNMPDDDGETSTDRHDPEVVREFVSRCYSDPTIKERCIVRLAESIRIAHEVSPATWTTSLSDVIRLNVGQLQTLLLSPNRLDLVVLKTALTEQEWNNLETNAGIVIGGGGIPFKTIRSAYRIEISTSHLDSALPLLEEAHNQLLIRAATDKPNSSFATGHWPGIPQYLREDLPDPTIPFPTYRSAGQPHPSTASGSWLFQANPTVWNLKEHLAEMSEGDSIDWSLSRYRDEVADGDRVVLWQAGSEAGIYGIGTIAGGPFKRPYSGYASGGGDDEGEETAINLSLDRKLERPILKADILRHPVLSKMSVLRQPNGSNFRVTTDEWAELQPFLDNRATGPTVADLSQISHLPVEHLAELEGLIRAKRQIVLEGPPGSGKTFVADLLARYLTGNPLAGEHNEQIELVQFHQSYGYEDFVQGIRPLTDENGQISYRVQPGIFIQMCERARANPDKQFVLIIDEINRGNISRIFGELMMLLEYRERKARLPYGPCKGADDGYLSIPQNLLLIGTMNSTDRSLALIDYALRRRFYFYRLLPVVDGQASVLGSWLQSQELTAEIRQHRLDLFVALNAELVKKKLPIDFQIGHSYFMQPDIDTDDGLKRVWTWGILPLLQEYFHTARDVDAILRDFSIEALVGESTPMASFDSLDESFPEI